jgi:hypothetical protein
VQRPHDWPVDPADFPDADRFLAQEMEMDEIRPIRFNPMMKPRRDQIEGVYAGPRPIVQGE